MRLRVKLLPTLVDFLLVRRSTSGVHLQQLRMVLKTLHKEPMSIRVVRCSAFAREERHSSFVKSFFVVSLVPMTVLVIPDVVYPPVVGQVISKLTELKTVLWDRLICCQPLKYFSPRSLRIFFISPWVSWLNIRDADFLRVDTPSEHLLTLLSNLLRKAYTFTFFLRLRGAFFLSTGSDAPPFFCFL